MCLCWLCFWVCVCVSGCDFTGVCVQVCVCVCLQVSRKSFLLPPSLSYKNINFYLYNISIFSPQKMYPSPYSKYYTWLNIRLISPPPFWNIQLVDTISSPPFSQSPSWQMCAQLGWVRAGLVCWIRASGAFIYIHIKYTHSHTYTQNTHTNVYKLYTFICSTQGVTY